MHDTKKAMHINSWIAFIYLPMHLYFFRDFLYQNENINNIELDYWYLPIFLINHSINIDIGNHVHGYSNKIYWCIITRSVDLRQNFFVVPILIYDS